MRSLPTSITLTCIICLLSFTAGSLCLAGDNNKEKPPDAFVKVDESPEMLEQIEPAYPAKARQEGIEGVVTIRSLINKAGVPAKVELGKSSGYEILDEAALKAAKKAKFKPALQGEQTVAVWVSYKVSFVLDKEDKKEHIKKD